MTWAPPHPCPHPHCSWRGNGRCPIHERKRDRQRGSALERGYDEAWAAYSRQWLLRHPWCGMRDDMRLHAEHSRCVQRGDRVQASVTDHIIPIRAGGARMDPRNHQSLCRGCNAAKDAARGPRL